MKEIIINKFDGGISRDIREPIESKFSITKHFDIFSYPNRLVPHRSTESAFYDESYKDYDIINFQLGSDNYLYGLGVQPSSTSRTKILKNVDPGNVVNNSSWSAPANAECSVNSSATYRECFIEWQGAFWMISNSVNSNEGYIHKWVMGGSFTSTASLGANVSYVAQGVIAPDNNLYVFYNNKVVRINNSGTITDAVLTLPSDGRITSATTYGNYLAIAWANGTISYSGGYSKVFLWDLVSSDVTETVEWGEGQLLILENLEGRLIGITDSMVNSSLCINNGSIIIRGYSGGTPSVLEKIICQGTATSFIRYKVKKENKLYFVAGLPFYTSNTGTAPTNLGIYCFGRRDVNSNYALTIDYIDENIPTAQYRIKGFGSAGNFWFINYSNDGSVSRTSANSNFTFKSVYESQKYNLGDTSKTKQLLGVSVSHSPFQSDSKKVVLKYKTDSSLAWCKVFTDNVDYGTAYEATSIEDNSDQVTVTIATPAVFLQTGHGLCENQKIRFATTGALPTGLSTNTDYYVVRGSSLTDDSFRVSLTPGGTAVNTSGSQSGTHTILRAAPLPIFKEIQFRIESTFGAEITELKFQAEEINSLLN